MSSCGSDPSATGGVAGVVRQPSDLVPQGNTRVLLVDDHLVVREGLRSLLSHEAGIEVVGEASSGKEALQKTEELRPDLVLMDIRMLDMTGIEATRQIKRKRPATSVIMLTMYDSELYVLEAMRAGAAGYLVKDTSRELLSLAIRAVAQGAMLIRNGLLCQAIQSLPGDSIGAAVVVGSSLVGRLTPREFDVFRLMARGYGNKTIGAELFLANVTVKKHVQSIISKLGVPDRTQAVLLAARLGLSE